MQSHPITTGCIERVDVFVFAFEVRDNLLISITQNCDLVGSSIEEYRLILLATGVVVNQIIDEFQSVVVLQF